jgi:outer membrane protein assembly factor BamC
MNKASLRRFRDLGLVAVCLLAVAACSNTKKEDDAYKHSKALPPLEMTPDLIGPAKDASTAIPELPPAAPAPASPAAPAPSTAAAPETSAAAAPSPAAASAAAASAGSGEASLHIERQGALRWLVVPAQVPQLQQRLKDFLVQKGFSFSTEEAAAGTLETEWRSEGEQPAKAGDLDAALKSGLQDKYKLRIESGRVPGTSEVTVTHLGLQQVMVNGQPQWQPRASDPMLEADMLEQLRAFLQSEGTAPEGSDLPAVKARIATDTEGVSTMTLNEDFDRAWRRVGLALGRGGFVVEDRNRSEGLYMIRLGTAFKEDAKAGFVARLFGSNAGDPNEKYRVYVKDKGDECAVIVEHPGGAPVHTSIGGRILDRLQEKME